VKIATFNVNSIRAHMHEVLPWLGQHKPDVLCLQETKVRDEEFPVEPITNAGYHVAYRGEKAYNGVAIISRLEPKNVRFGMDDRGPSAETRLIQATIGGVTVVNTYVPQGQEVGSPMYAFKLEWLKRLRGYFSRHFSPDDAVIWAGDMNVAQEPIDVYNPGERENHVCYHIDARKGLAKCREWGFTDVLRIHHPEPGLYTFFDYRMRDTVKRNIGWRVDCIFATEPLTRKSRDAYIDLKPRLGRNVSDHTFLVAEFD